MDLRWKSLGSLALVFSAVSVARGDVLELTALGNQRVGAIQQRDAQNFGGRPIVEAHLDPLNRNPNGFVRGMIVMERNALGQLAATGPNANFLNGQPEKYFVFRPYNWIGRNAQGNFNRPDYVFEWAWVASVHQEIDTLDDLCMAFSWRCQAPPGSQLPQQIAAFQRGLRQFLGLLDPQNQLGIGGGAGQPSPNNVHEGYLTRFLFYGGMTGPERSARLMDTHRAQGPIGQYGSYDAQNNRATWQANGVRYTPMDSDWCEQPADTAVTKLLEAMCRGRESPSRPGTLLWNVLDGGAIRANARLGLQCLTSTLASVPEPITKTDQNAKRIRAYAFRARAALLGAIENASPERIAILRRRQVLMRPGEGAIDAQLRHTGLDDALPASVFDMADQAMDVLLWNQGNTNTGMTTPYLDDKARVVSALLRVAAGAQAYNGGVQNLQIQDTIGYKAMQTLTKLAEPQQTGADFREQIVQEIASAQNETIQNAAKDVLLRAAIANESANEVDVQREIQTLFEVALASTSAQSKSFYESPPASGNYLPQPSENPRRTDAIWLLKQLAGRGSAISTTITQRVDQIRKNQQQGTGSTEEKKFLETWGN